MTGGVTVPDEADSAGTGVAVPTIERPTRPSTRALVVLTAVPLLILVLDQISKQLALTNLAGHPPVRLFGGLIYLNLTRNSGAAFSIGGHYTYIFPIITVAVVIGIGWLSRRLRSVPWAVSFGLIAGGAVGNLVDRMFRTPGVFRGEVVDMISLFDEAGRVFPAGAIFNVADSSLFCGVVLAVILEFTGRRRDGSRDSRRSR